MSRIENLQVALQTELGDKVESIQNTLGELTVRVSCANYLQVATLLRDCPALRFETLIDLCGVDYSTYGDGRWDGPRFAVVSHFLSVTNNHRVRLVVFATDDDFPVIPSLFDLYAASGWYEREAFDLFGLMFDGHPDLRRLLTDYGFVGHPFRKDFPVSGHVEMRYDPEQKRVVYQPVTIDPREVVPRIIREEGYGVGR
jgi:NADH-quinone oxidoreductase subunit C